VTALALCTVLLGFAPCPGPDYDASLAALERGDYARAWSEAQAEEDPLLNARARAEVLYLGRDFPGVLAAVRDGLAVEPSETTLLWRGAAAALWLRDGERALEFVARLREVLPTLALSSDEVATWERSLGDYTAQARAESSRAVERDLALARSRTTAYVLGALSLGLLVLTGWLSRRG
jgi:hypothetical protein